MMRRTYSILLLTGLIAVCIASWAQQAKKKTTKVFMPPVYLGNSGYTGGAIRKAEFDQLLKQGLQAHDSLGNKYRIVGFDFSYAERNLYEDSSANLVLLADFSSEYCTGDTISSDISQSTEDKPSLYDRTKAGDTAYFSNILLTTCPGNTILTIPDTVTILGRDMKFVITK